MKQLILFLLASVCISAYAQNGSSLSYSEVVQVDSSLSKDELYKRARAWFTEVYKDTHKTLEIEDRPAGELSGSGSMKFIVSFAMGNAGNGTISYKVRISVKDGKYKYEINSFVHEGSDKYIDGTNFKGTFGLITTDEECPKANCPYKAYPKVCEKTWKEIKERIKGEVLTLSISLSDYMKSPVKKSDW